MPIFILKLLTSATLISFVSTLASKRPILAGYLTALPLTSMLALSFMYLETKDNVGATLYAKSIFVAVPLSLLFFVPFLLQAKTALPFLANFVLGIGLLWLGYFLHQKII